MRKIDSVVNTRALSRGWRPLLLSLLAGVLLAGCGGTTLYGNLDEQQVNEMMAALVAAGVPAEKRSAAVAPGSTGWQLVVDSGDIPKAMEVLRSHRLPQERYVSMCETFKKEGFASSNIEERARYQCSLQQELAHTLSGIPGVAEARVHVALPERDAFGNESSDSSASVTIFQKPGADVRANETNIKVTVKDSIEGLDSLDKVTVKFYTLGGPQASRSDSAPRATVAGFSFLAIGIAAGAVLLLGLIAMVIGRMRSRSNATQAAAQAANNRVWNG